MRCDAIVNAANITKAYNLPCRYILHTVGPIIRGPLTKADCEQLADCYRSCLELASKNHLESVAFCCISTGEFHFSNDMVAQILVREPAFPQNLTVAEINTDYLGLLRIVKNYLSCNVRFLCYSDKGSGEFGKSETGKERKNMRKNMLKIMAIVGMLSVSAVRLSAAEPVMASESVSAKRSVKQYYVTSDVLNVRSGPGTDYPVIGSLTHGMKVKVFSVKGEKGNRWAKIRFEGLTSYVSAKHLAKN
ncbi:O-acetyl-ADP-ribose deacetylase [Eubacterium plexicaudatum ASF492]|uniref:SH3b domain-containing protein n=1 Tax=Eubacterium plexicaudatum ASF492 TaxID=1235802 RepID=N2A6G8_9FIRM|nr:O-acetyl-ADP-ribose deacetylase [Eubacterium plexicaudatum ASF492]